MAGLGQQRNLERPGEDEAPHGSPGHRRPRVDPPRQVCWLREQYIISGQIREIGFARIPVMDQRVRRVAAKGD